MPDVHPELGSPLRTRCSVLGVNVDVTQIPDVILQIEKWVSTERQCHFVAVTGMHGVMEAQHESAFKKILNSADLVVPDGMPLIWIARLRGYKLKRRVYGPELMLTIFDCTKGMGYRHFFYGGEPRVADRLAAGLQQRFPGTTVAGIYSPPFRQLTPEEDAEIVERINQTRPDILWVGLSTPKQERWMYAHRDSLCVPVLIGVGAAFDINSGAKLQAPAWMQEHGLEWLFRLLQEPKRLWRRYVVYGSEFIVLVALEFLGVKRFK